MQYNIYCLTECIFINNGGSGTLYGAAVGLESVHYFSQHSIDSASFQVNNWYKHCSIREPASLYFVIIINYYSLVHLYSYSNANSFSSFIRNAGSRGGTVGISYYALMVSGHNYFTDNIGPALRVSNMYTTKYINHPCSYVVCNIR